LIERQPNDFFVNGRLAITTKQPGQLIYVTPAVAALPNCGGGVVQAKGFVSLQIINQQFTRYLPGHEVFFSRLW